MTAPDVRVVAPATCLGCGCTCDDIEVVVTDGRIAEARRACALGAAWFGDGAVPGRATVDGGDVAPEAALEAMAAMLARAARPLVYLAPDLSCEAQRGGAAIADGLRTTLDTVTTDSALPSILAMQERGRAGATLGEVRHRCDVLVWWGVDPAARYPRYPTRYAPEPRGMHVPDGRRSRTVVAVDVGEARAAADADLRVAVRAGDEVATLVALRALVAAEVTAEGPAWTAARTLAEALRPGRYVVVVADAEPSPGRDAGRADALVALTQALNGPTRAALSTLRAGGNRVGADAVLTAQTGYPLAVDLARGFPRYRPHDGGLARAARGEIDAALVIGAWDALPPEVQASLGAVRRAVVGPRASAVAGAAAAIDTGVAGIHDGGTALRMDDVPLPLRPSVVGPRAAVDVLRALQARLTVARAAAGSAA